LDPGVFLASPTPVAQISRRNLAPTVERDHRQAGVERIERRGRHYYDVSESQRFPSPMAVESHAMRTEDKGVFAAGAPYCTPGQRSILAENALVLSQFSGNAAPAVAQSRAHQAMIAAVVAQTPASLPGKINVDLLDALFAGQQSGGDGLQHGFLLLG